MKTKLALLAALAAVLLIARGQSTNPPTAALRPVQKPLGPLTILSNQIYTVHGRLTALRYERDQAMQRLQLQINARKLTPAEYQAAREANERNYARSSTPLNQKLAELRLKEFDTRKALGLTNTIPTRLPVPARALSDLQRQGTYAP